MPFLLLKQYFHGQKRGSKARKTKTALKAASDCPGAYLVAQIGRLVYRSEFA